MNSPSDQKEKRPSEKAKLRLIFEILIIGILVFLLYAPSLSTGRMVDDMVILEKSERLPLPLFLLEGMKIERDEIGDVWWIQQEFLFHYFRPLLLFSFWLPQQLMENSDFLQHVLNLLLHFFAAVTILLLGRNVLKDNRAAFLAAVLFTVSIHHLLTVPWIAARKEILTGLMLVLAFFSHHRKRWLAASLAFAGALLSGEHAVLFPVLVLIWGLFEKLGQKTHTDSSSLPRGFKSPWLIYAGILSVYAAIRYFALGGVPLPAAPYFQAPFQGQFFVHTLLKLSGFFFSLACSVPLVTRWIIWEWINQPIFLGICLLVTAGIFVFLILSARQRRLCIVLLLLAILSFTPFLIIEALPFHIYSPLIFFSLAVGAALARHPSTQPAKPAKMSLYGVVLVVIFINFSAELIFNWSAMGDILKIPPDLNQKLSLILEGKAKDRPILFVDMPNTTPGPYFHFINSFSKQTGRDPALMAIISAKRDNTSGFLSELTRLAPRSFLITRKDKPFFDTALRNLAWFFPEGLIKKGSTFSRSFYSVTIAEVPDEKAFRSRAQRFFSKEGGIKSLRIDVGQEYPSTLVIGFNGRDPRIILDMQDGPYNLRAQDSSLELGVDYLLRRLARKDGIPPRSVERPANLIPGSGPKQGVGPLLVKMSQRDPVFRRAYFSFLRYLDQLNTELSHLGEGPFFMQSAMYGAESYAKSIEAIGGKSDVAITSNSLGVTWDSIMDKARDIAVGSLAQESLDLTPREKDELVNLLALGQMAAISNRLIPEEYLEEWEKLHPDRLQPPSDPPSGVLRRLWYAVCESIPWMYHAGAMPWKEFPADNPHQAFDVFHFFTHAWIVHYNLYRERHFQGKDISLEIVERELRASRQTSVAHEAMTLFANQGFLEMTPLEYLPEKLQILSRYLYLRGIPVLEAFRDIRVGNEGAVYGAALAIAGTRLKPSDTDLHTQILNSVEKFLEK